jgi:hypothetical protein
MNESEILEGFHSGKYTFEEVLDFYQRLKDTIRYPLSEGQKGLWLLHKLEPASNVYNVPICFRIDARMDLETFKQAFGEAVARHDQLSCIIIEEEEAPFLVPQPFNLDNVVTVACERSDGDEFISRLRSEAKKPFDLLRDPFVRMSIYTLSPVEHVVLIVVHHFVFDGASAPIFLADLFSFYEALTHGQAIEPAKGRTAYADFVQWEQLYLEGKQGEKDQAYWLSQLKGELPSLKLDFERSDIDVISVKGATTATSITGSEIRSITEFCSKHRIKPMVFFLSVFQMLLQRYTGTATGVL